MPNIDTPESPENIEEGHKFAGAFYAGIDLTLQAYKEYNPYIAGILPAPGRMLRDRIIIKNLWPRAYGWVSSLQKLNETLDYQGMAAGCRALIEILVDVVLLTESDGDHAAGQMFIFADSEKLKMCQSVTKYFKDRGEVVPDAYTEQEGFIARNLDRLMLARNERWGGKHPPRWTGRDLSQDVEAIDKLHSAIFIKELEMPLTKLYRTEYRRICWHIHSGLASTWEMPAETFSTIAGFSLKWSAELAMLIVQFIQKDLRILEVNPQLEVHWQALRDARVKIFAERVLGYSELT